MSFHDVITMKQIRAVFFDLDNTLIDFMQMKEKACRAAVEAMIQAGLRMDREAAYSRLMEVYFEVGIESDKGFTRFLEMQGQFKHKILAAAINAYLNVKNNYLKAYPHTKQTLQALRNAGVTLVVVSDAPKTKAYQRLLAMNMDSYFDFVVGYEDTKQKKRGGTPLRLAIEKLKEKMPKIENDQILMVGDSIDRDIHPAKKLGLNTALAKYGQREYGKGKADYELTDIRDVLSIVQPKG